MGWMFFYAGITKVLNPEWSAGGFLNNAKTFAGFYKLLASPGMLTITNFINEWGLTLLGVSLFFGIGIRWSSKLGALLMILYYLPNLDFPYPNEHAYIVDEHIIYIAALLLVGSLASSQVLSLGKWLGNLPACSRYPWLRKLIS